MITAIGDNCITPLGQTTSENVAGVLSGASALRQCKWGCAAAFASEINPIEGFNRFETLCVRSIDDAVASSSIGIDTNSPNVRFVLSSTKGDIEHLGTTEFRTLIESAQLITRHFGNPNVPLVVSNACTSGVCALIYAMRLLTSGEWGDSKAPKYVVVTGADLMSEFVVSGFGSFKALSDEPCRPFDAARKGLNLGEAAATLILTDAEISGWHLLSGSIHNDANHISGPSRSGEGSFRCLNDVLNGYDISKLALVCCHGTATNYNDEMESIALHRAALDALPVNSLKPYFGHTLGAAGVLETVVSIHALEQGLIPATVGYVNQGTTFAMNVSGQTRTANQMAFVKLISGFGGTNAAVLFEKS